MKAQSLSKVVAASELGSSLKQLERLLDRRDASVRRQTLIVNRRRSLTPDNSEAAAEHIACLTQR